MRERVLKASIIHILKVDTKNNRKRNSAFDASQLFESIHYELKNGKKLTNV